MGFASNITKTFSIAALGTLAFLPIQTDAAPIDPLRPAANLGETINTVEATDTNGNPWSTMGKAQIIQITYLPSELCTAAAYDTSDFLRSRATDGDIPLTIITLDTPDDFLAGMNQEKIKNVTIVQDDELNLAGSILKPVQFKVPISIVIDDSGEIVYMDVGHEKGREASTVLALEYAVSGNEEKLAELREVMKLRMEPEGWVGKQFPDDSSIEMLRGEFSAEGKYAMYEFWATWCGPCHMVAPELQRIHDEHSEDIALVSISNEDQKTVTNFLNKKDSTYPVGIDSDLGGLLGIRSIPHAVIVNPEGTIIWMGNPITFMRDNTMLPGIIEADKKS